MSMSDADSTVGQRGVPGNLTSSSSSSSSAAAASISQSVRNSAIGSSILHAHDTKRGVSGNLPLSARPALEKLLVANDSETLESLQCGVCFSLLQDPKQCQNGHLFCDRCISQCLMRTSECPHCRCDLSLGTLGRSLFVERAISNLTVHCPFYFKPVHDLDVTNGNSSSDATSEAPPAVAAAAAGKVSARRLPVSTADVVGKKKIYVDSDDDWVEDDESGCPALVRFDALESHERECDFAFRLCEWGDNRCPPVRLNQFRVHASVCPFRPSHCRSCDLDVELNEMEAHLAVCPKVVLTCSDCGEHTCAREEMDAHRVQICPNAVLDCDFAKDGCDVKLKRKEMSQHVLDETARHMSLMRTGFEKQLRATERAHALEMKQLTDRIRHVERQTERAETRIEWRVRNWSRMRHKGYLQSERFTFANMNWFIGFYTNGDSPESAGSISEYLFLDTSSCPANKRVTIEFSLRFVNHKEPEQTVRKEFKTTFPIKGGQGWGDRRAILVSRLTESEGFIHRDTLVMEATISLKRTLWSV